MSGKRWQPLNRLVALADTERDKSAGRLSTESGNHQAARSRLDQLLAFRGEYEAKLAAMTARGLSAGQLRDYRQFLESLAEAIDQQTAVVARAGEQLAERRQDFAERSRDCNQLQNLIDRYQREEARRQEKRLQRQIDDQFATRAGDQTDS
ncbi:MAG: flagellar export protein FliJ [Parahaliea sp.]